MSQPIRGQDSHFVFQIGPKNTNLVEDVEILLPVKFRWKPLNRIQRNLTGSKILTSSTKFVFFGPIGKTKWPSWPLIG